MEPKPGDVIIVLFSCGAPSAVAAKRTIERYGDICTVRVVNNFILEEDTDNRRFLTDIELWIGQKIEPSINPKYPNCSAVEVWDDRQYMSGINGAPCTLELKKNARYYFESQNRVDWIVLGYTAEEKKRHEQFIFTERETAIPVLIQDEITRDQCFEIIDTAGIALPLPYLLGFPNANCIGCVKATSPTYWNHVRKHYPHVFAERAVQSRRIGCKLVRYKGKRIFLDELPPDAAGRPLKSMKMPECGLFCEEKPF